MSPDGDPQEIDFARFIGRRTVVPVGGEIFVHHFAIAPDRDPLVGLIYFGCGRTKAVFDGGRLRHNPTQFESFNLRRQNLHLAFQLGHPVLFILFLPVHRHRCRSHLLGIAQVDRA